MSKNNGAVLDLPEPIAARIAPGTLQEAVNFDEAESILLETAQDDAVPVKFAILDNPEQAFKEHLDSVESFDSVFAADPLKEEYRAIGAEGRNQFDAPDICRDRVKLGSMMYNVMLNEKKIAPSAYSRKKVIRKLETAFRLSNVPESVKIQDIIKLFWVVRMDQSRPNDDNTRSFVGNTSDPEWYGGNISCGSLEPLKPLIDRVNGDDETDVFEYKKGMEDFSRKAIARLRKGDLSKRQVEALVECQKKILAAEAERIATLGMSAAKLKDREDDKLAKAREAKLAKLETMISSFKEFADECGLSKDEVALKLTNKRVIAPIAATSIDSLARNLTPGDAKALVHRLKELIPIDKTRAQVIAVLAKTVHEVLQQSQSAKNESQGQARKTA